MPQIHISEKHLTSVSVLFYLVLPRFFPCWRQKTQQTLLILKSRKEGLKLIQSLTWDLGQLPGPRCPLAGNPTPYHPLPGKSLFFSFTLLSSFFPPSSMAGPRPAVPCARREAWESQGDARAHRSAPCVKHEDRSGRLSGLTFSAQAA